jgi:acyl-CoA synthetase (AMP-forming)/AMP-acid ligase II
VACMTETITSWVENHARRIPEACAFSFISSEGVSRSWSWLQLNNASERVASLLSRKKVKERDHVGIVGKNSPAFYVALLALLKLGAVAVPISPLMNGASLLLLLSNADCAVCVADQDVVAEGLCVVRTSEVARAMDDALVEQQQRRHNVTPSDCCHIMYSSGTTGTPKVV